MGNILPGQAVALISQNNIFSALFFNVEKLV